MKARCLKRASQRGIVAFSLGAVFLGGVLIFGQGCRAGDDTIEEEEEATTQGAQVFTDKKRAFAYCLRLSQLAYRICQETAKTPSRRALCSVKFVDQTTACTSLLR